MINKKKFFFILFFFLSQSYSQKNELGIFIGGSNYVGDVGPTTFINPNDIIGGLIYKRNLNNRIGLRGSVSYGNLYSSDRLPGSSNDRRIRGYNFINKFHKNNLQPPPAAGTNPNPLKNVNDFSLPISLGLKFKPLEKKITYGIEISANYSFTDDLDGSTTPPPIGLGPFGGSLSNDWYFFSVFKITYIFGKHKCYCP